jgi:hypothetical protein
VHLIPPWPVVALVHLRPRPPSRHRSGQPVGQLVLGPVPRRLLLQS